MSRGERAPQVPRLSRGERAPQVPRLSGSEQAVQDGLTFLDVPTEVVATVHGAETAGCVLATRSQVYVRWFDEHGVPHLGWLAASAVREVEPAREYESCTDGCRHGAHAFSCGTRRKVG